MRCFFNHDPRIIRVYKYLSVSCQSNAIALQLPPVSRTRLGVTIKNARTATMGELSAVKNVGLSVPSGRMVCLGIFLAVFAYSFTGCLANASLPTPVMAPVEMNSNNEEVSGDNGFQYPASNGRDDENSRGLEALLRREFVLYDNSAHIKINLETLKSLEDVYSNSNGMGMSNVDNTRSNVENEENVENLDGNKLSSRDLKTVLQGVKRETPEEKTNRRNAEDQDYTPRIDIPQPSSKRAESVIVESTTSKSIDDSTMLKIPLSNIIVNNNNANSGIQIPRQNFFQKEVVKNDNSKNKRDEQENLDPIESKKQISGSNFNSDFTQIEKDKNASLIFLIQNNVQRLKPSLDELYERALKHIHRYLDMINKTNRNNTNNYASDLLSWNDTGDYSDFTNDDYDNVNDDRLDSDVDLNDLPPLDLLNNEEDFNYFKDHLRGMYDVLHTAETQTISEDKEFWANASRILHPSNYLRLYLSRTKRRARRKLSRRGRDWQARRRQQIQSRLSVTYSQVVPCQYSDRFYCRNGGTCVFVQALEVKLCRCPVGYTGIRCEYIDREYILTVLTNQLLSNSSSRFKLFR